MSEQHPTRRPSRRAILLGGAGAATIVGARALASPAAPAGGTVAQAATTDLSDARLAAAIDPDIHLAATDGWVSIADHTTISAATTTALAPFWPDPLAANHGAAPDALNLYVFGFRNVTGMTADEVISQRGQAQISAPQLVFDEGQEYRVKLSNLGLSQRPDLVDGHTIHWHGFVNEIPLFDGVPELSISVPIGRDFTYYYRPFDAGTYMYHCHFEDVEHVQMGMTGLLFVRPQQNGTAKTFQGKSFSKFVYNDGDGSTGYDREFGVFLTEIFAEGHYRDAHIQTTDWTDFKASFWAINGRTYPDTVAPAAPLDPAATADPTRKNRGFDVSRWKDDGTHLTERLQYQPQSALVTCNAGERVLLRMASLGYQNHAMTLDAVPMQVVGKDASQLRNPAKAGGTVNHYIDTSVVELGPGESRDVLFWAPAYDAGLPGGTDAAGRAYNTYLLYDRTYAYASNGGDASSMGGMATEIHVYPAGTLTDQLVPNDAYPTA